MMSGRTCQEKDADTKIYQCYFSQDSYKTKCEKLTVDQYCHFDDNKRCVRRADVSLEANHECKLTDNGACLSLEYECSDYNSNCNQHGNKCFKVTGESYCKIVEVDGKCTIDNNGACVGKETGGPEDFEECRYNQYKTECKPINKICSAMDIDKCSRCKATSSGYSCLKVGQECKEIKIDSSCKIDDAGQCVKNSGETNSNICQFDNTNTICQFYQVDSQCAFASGTRSCSDGATLENANKKKCDLIIKSETKFACEPRDRKCSELVSGVCETIKSDTKKCSLNGVNCEEYTIDQYCTVDGGVCQSAGGNLGTNYECLFGINVDSKTCVRKQKVCENYYNNCDAHKNNTHQCIQFGTDNSNYCIAVKFDDYCQYSTTLGRCNEKDTVDINENLKCVNINDDSYNIKGCEKKPKVCSDYGYTTCNSQQKCYYYNTKCYETEEDDYCSVINGECKKKDNANLKENEKCDFSLMDSGKFRCEKKDKVCLDYNDNSEACNSQQKCYYSGNCREKEEDNYCSFTNGECKKRENANINENYEKCDFSNIGLNKDRCEKVQKHCSEIDDPNICNAAPEREEDHKCFYKSSRCNDYNFDEKCTLNQEGKCVENGSGKLTQYEICKLYEDSTYNYLDCHSEEKKCSDYGDNECGGFTPEMKLCFYINNECEEVAVDSQCKMNENNECTGNSCHFDEENYRCYYQEEKNNSSLLKMNQIILLILLFVF